MVGSAASLVEFEDGVISGCIKTTQTRDTTGTVVSHDNRLVGWINSKTTPNRANKTALSIAYHGFAGPCENIGKGSMKLCVTTGTRSVQPFFTKDRCSLASLMTIAESARIVSPALALHCQ